MGFGSSNLLKPVIRLVNGERRAKGSLMKQINNTAPMPGTSRTWETLGMGDYYARSSDIASPQRGVSISLSVLHQTELPSRRWLIEASRS